MIAFAGIVTGILLLIFGGTALVHGATKIAARLGISPIVVGLTVVAFGTSMPELVVNVVGALHGETGLAFGNVIGSNIANLALVLGVAAIIRPLLLNGNLVQREVPLLLSGTTVLSIFALDQILEGSPGVVIRSDALVLLLIFAGFIYITVMDVLRSKQKDALVTDMRSNPLVDMQPEVGFAWLFVVFGILFLYGGGELTVGASVKLAQRFNLPMAEIGLIIVALGTSMPELVTSVVAAIRQEPDLAVGNVIGSNIFNALLVLPVSALVRPIVTPPGGLLDLAFSWALAAMLIPVFILGKAKLGRIPGLLLLLSYIAWVVFRIG
jgi:cation:H+ antiporter